MAKRVVNRRRISPIATTGRRTRITLGAARRIDMGIMRKGVPPDELERMAARPSGSCGHPRSPHPCAADYTRRPKPPQGRSPAARSHGAMRVRTHEMRTPRRQGAKGGREEKESKDATEHP